MAHTSPGGPISAQCLLNAVDDETLGQWIDVRGEPYLVFYCTSAGTTSSGVISFEEAAPKDFSSAEEPAPVFGAATGNYSVITTVNASTFSSDAQLAVHVTNAAYCYVRARVSTVIGGGGTVSVGLVAY